MKSQSGGTVEAFEDRFRLRIILLQWFHCFFDSLKAKLLIRHFNRPRLIFVCSKVLDFLTGIFDFCEAQGRGGAFEEMAERA